MLLKYLYDFPTEKYSFLVALFDLILFVLMLYLYEYWNLLVKRRLWQGEGMYLREKAVIQEFAQLNNLDKSTILEYGSHTHEAFRSHSTLIDVSELTWVGKADIN